MSDLWGRLAEFARQAQAQRQPAWVPPPPQMPWGDKPPVQYTPSTESLHRDIPVAPPAEHPLPDYSLIPPKTPPPQPPPISSRFGMPWTGRGPQPSLDNREYAQWPPRPRAPGQAQDPNEVRMDPGAALDALNSLPPGHPDRALWEAVVRQSAQGGR